MSKISIQAIKPYYQLKISFHLNVICAFSSRHLKNMSLYYGDTRDCVSNRKRFLSELGIDYNRLVCARQVHGRNIKYVQEEDIGKGALSYHDSIPDTDGFITDKKNIPLAIFTADCLPIFLYNPAIPAIGLIHAGWRSTKEGISVHAVQLMRERFNSQPEDIHVGLGPCIRNCCYEIEERLSESFSYGIIKRNNRYYLDLAEVNKQQLFTLGVKPKNIFDSEICTSCRNEDFFSYRKEGRDCGRIMSAIILK